MRLQRNWLIAFLAGVCALALTLGFWLAMGVPAGRGLLLQRAPLLPIPPIEEQVLLGDLGVREGMTVDLPNGPKVFWIRFSSPPSDRSRTEVSLRNQCTPCALNFHWKGDRELLVFIPEDDMSPGDRYTIGSISVGVSVEPRALWEIDVTTGTRMMVADLTGLNVHTMSPDGKHVLVERPHNAFQATEPRSTYYFVDLLTGARSEGRLGLVPTWVPEDGGLVLHDDGVIRDLRGNTVRQISDGLVVASPKGFEARWVSRRAFGQWDLVISHSERRALRFSLPDTADPAPSLSGERVQYPLWSLRWSRDGTKLLVMYATLDMKARVFLIDLNAGTMDERYFDPVDQNLIWHPDGSRIAAPLSHATTVYDVNGYKLGTYAGRLVSWSPSGSYMAFLDRVIDTTGQVVLELPRAATPIGWRSDRALIVQGPLRGW